VSPEPLHENWRSVRGHNHRPFLSVLKGLFPSQQISGENIRTQLIINITETGQNVLKEFIN
jgi:hypothetical protein